MTGFSGSHCLTKNPRSSLKERTTENRTGFLGFLDTELRQNLNLALGEFIRILAAKPRLKTV